MTAVGPEMARCFEFSLERPGLKGVRFLLCRPTLPQAGDLESGFFDGVTNLVRHPVGSTFTEVLREVVERPCKTIAVIRNTSLVLDDDLPRRIGAALQYCAGYLRPQENYFLMIRPEEVAGYPERLQRLLGYGLFRGLLGHIDERDPRAVLGAPVERRLVYDDIDDALPAPTGSES